MNDITDYLSTKNIEYKVSGNEILLTCPECGKEKLSINRESGLYKCWHCETLSPESIFAKGHFGKLQEYWGDIVPINHVSTPKANKPDPDYTDLVERYHYNIWNEKQALKYLYSRGFTDDTIMKFKLGFVRKDEQGWISIPSYEDGIPKLIKYRKTPPNEREDLPKYTREAGGKTVLFNGDILDNYDEIYLVEGEAKALSMIQNGYDNVVGITGGAKTFPSEWWDRLVLKSKVYLCYDKDTNIITEDGYKNITDINIGDKVYSHTGKLNEVTETISNIYTGNMYKFSLSGQSIVNASYVTEDHPILTYKKDNIKKRKNQKIYSGTLEWCKSKDIQIGDRLVFPVLLNSYSDSIISSKFKRRISSRDSKGRILKYDRLMEEIDISNMDFVKDNNFSYLIGAFIGDGHYKRYRSSGRFEVSGHCLDKKEMLSRIRNYFIKYNISYSEHLQDNCITIYSYDYRLSFFRSFYKDNIKNLSLKWIFHNLISKKELFQGLIDSDGSISNKKYNYIKFTNTNKSIILFVEILSSLLNYSFSTTKFKHKNPSWKEVYNIHLVKKKKENKVINIYKEFGGVLYYLLKVKNIDSKYVINEKVYNLEVSNDNSYITQQKVSTHNCLDSDAIGQKAARDTWATRLGRDKCYNILLPTHADGSKIDIDEFFLDHTKEDFDKLVSKAERFKVEGVLSLKESLYKLGTSDESLLSKFSTPWESVNKLLGGGLQRSHLLTVSGQPASGKTTLCLNIAHHFGEIHEVPSLVFCLEMSEADLTFKLIQYHYDLVANEIAYKDALYYAQEDFGNLPIYLGYSPKITPEIFYNTAKEVKARFGIELFIFDNLHLMVRSDKESDISSAVKVFKDIAMELNIFMIMVAQPRKINSERNMTAADIKSSSSFFSDSDEILLLNRKRLTTPEGGSFDPVCTIIADKTRYAEGGRCKLFFEGNKSKWREILT